MAEELRVTVDVGSIIPISEQIRAQIADLVRTGSLTQGTRLPTVRDLATDLGISVNTVNKAYAELERQGLTASRRRAGTLVTGNTAPSTDTSRTRAAAKHLAESARAEGVDEETAIAILKEALREAGHA